MTAAQQTNSEKQNLTSEIAVDLLNPPKKSKKFGILDIQADSICTPPQFTEETTISAMKNLGISPDDLVLISERPDELSSVSENSGMRVQLNNELEKKRLEAIEKIIEERNRIIAEEDIEISVPKTIDDSENEIDKTNQTQPPRKKKKAKSNLKTGNKKSKVKKKNTENDSNFDNEILIARNTKRRRRKSTKSSIHRFQPQKSKLPAKARSSLSPGVNDEKPSTNRRPSVAERRQKYSSQLSQNQAKSERKNNFIESEANRKNDMMLINIKVKANEERCRMEREEKRQLIKKQAQLRMERLKGEETQFERMKRDKKTKAEEEMKRKERLYMKIQEKKMKALEQERKKRQQKIYNSKVKQEENNETEDRFSKLRQKIIDAQINNPNFNHDNSQRKDDDDADLFSVTRPKNPKILTVKSDDLSDSLTDKTENLLNAYSKSGVNNNNSISAKRNTSNPSEYSNDLPWQKSKPVANAKPLLSSTLNPQPVRKPLPRQNPKAKSSLQSMNSGYYRQLLKLPVVGKNKTRIPCLRK